MPIIKSNAYGHGMIEVAKIISPSANYIGVVSLGEALELRRNKIKNKIFVLSYIQNELISIGLKQGIEFPIYDLKSAVLISKNAEKLNIKAKIHIKIDTGTSRMGILEKEAISFIKRVRGLPNLKIVGLYSHFASSEDNPKFTEKQLAVFNKILFNLEKEGIEIPKKHFACSAALLVAPNSYFNFVRLGLGLYGLWPSDLSKKIALRRFPKMKLKPALTWKTKIIQIKVLPKNSLVGYGGTFKTKRETKIAVLSCGYWEGYDRKLSNKSFVQIKNKKCLVIGRVCMNLMMVDISGLKSARVGDEAVLLGKKITAEHLADIIKTINYEVITKINPLLRRVVVK